MSEYWLKRVLRENAKRFKQLPKAIRDAEFSYVRASKEQGE